MTEEKQEKRVRRRLNFGLVATCRLVDFDPDASFAKKLDQVNARIMDMSEGGVQLEFTGPFDQSGFLAALMGKISQLVQKNKKPEEDPPEKIYRFGPTQVTLGVQINIPETNKHIEILGWIMWFKQTKNGRYRMGVRFSESRNMEIFEHYLGGKAIVLHWK